MTSQRWQQVNQLFQATLEQNPEARQAFLAQVCAGDSTLMEEINGLLTAHEESGDLMDYPAHEFAAQILVEAPATLATGEQLNVHRILSPIGVGGMGEVYLAYDMQLERNVALKVLPTIFTHDAKRLAQFHREAKAAAALNHPNIATIYSIEEAADYHFITMEYIDGQPLSAPIYKQSCDLDLFYQWFVPLTDALAHAHEHGVIHRDIKPGNIMLTAAGTPKLLDFGLARINREEVDASAVGPSWSVGAAMGTPTYMSPEQAKGEPVGSASDLFSLGVICYEFLCGQHPFATDAQVNLKQAIMAQTPLAPSHHKPDLPRALETLILQMLEKEPSRRPAAAEVRQRLMPLTAQQQQPDDRRSTVRTRSKTRWRIAFLVLGLALLVGSVMAFFYFNRRPMLTDKDTILLTEFVNQTGDEVFDDALKKSLAAQLEQSPFLNLFSDERVRESLRLMNRSPDEQVTTSLGREICQRQGLKALLTGSIVPLGRSYMISLEAINAPSGDVLAHEQGEANSKEQVLRTLGEIATRMREKLGESLSSIQKFAAPPEQVTTSSLEAFKAFSMGAELNAKGRYLEAISSLKHALELDPDFARAYSTLASAYTASEQHRLAVEAAQKAFALRGRVTERERLHITSQYYESVTGEIHKQIETLELLRQIYPNDAVARRTLGNRYNVIGQYEQAIEELRAAIRLNPNYGSPYRTLANVYLRLSRFDEARAMGEQVIARGFDSVFSRGRFFEIALIQGDTAAMQQQIDWASRRPGEYEHLIWLSRQAVFTGQWQKAREFRQQAVALARQRKMLETAGEIENWTAEQAATLGLCRQSRTALARAAAFPRAPKVFFGAGIALALCGEPAQAQALNDEATRRYPSDTLVNEIQVPLIRAALELRRGKRRQTIQILQAVRRYENVSYFYQNHLRGHAWLGEGNGTEAAREFQTILANRGWTALQPLYPLAHLGLARAALLQGHTTQARQHYQDFFALWKDADADLPVLMEAKKEYEKLK